MGSVPNKFTVPRSTNINTETRNRNCKNGYQLLEARSASLAARLSPCEGCVASRQQARSLPSTHTLGNVACLAF